MNNQKGQALIIVAVLALVLILGAVSYFIFIKHQTGSLLTGNFPNGQPTQENANNVQASVPAVNTPQDLTTVSNDLDNTNIGDLTTQLSQNDSDASSF